MKKTTLQTEAKKLKGIIDMLLEYNDIDDGGGRGYRGDEMGEGEHHEEYNEIKEAAMVDLKSIHNSLEEITALLVSIDEDVNGTKPLTKEVANSYLKHCIKFSDRLAKSFKMLQGSEHFYNR